MGWSGIVAIVLGCVVVAAVAALRPDPGTEWEGRAALGFLGVIVAGPPWIAQAVLTAISGTGWLWAWFVAAPLIGGLVPTRPSRPRGVPGLGEALRLEMVLGWQALGSPAGWEPCLSPPLPAPGGGRVWFCFAQAPESPALVQVAAPWARLDLGPEDTAPRQTRLADVLEPLGTQAVVPVDTRRIPPAAVLEEWRAHYGLVAAHPLVASHLP